jgi:succinoglycan biosynthesis transport protein ExoP
VALSPLDNQTGVEGFQIREYLAVIRLRKWMIFAVTAVVVAAALAFSFQQPPVYESEAQVLVRPVVLNDGAPDLDTLNLETETLIATSPEVANIAINDPAVEEVNPRDLLKGLDVSSAPDTEVLVFRYSHRDPEEVRDRAQAFATAYIANRRAKAQASIEQAQEPISENLAELRDELEAATAAGDESSQASIQTQIDFQLERLSILAGSSNPDIGGVLYDAYEPQAPSSPDHTKTGAIALLAGLGLGVGAAFLKERLDDRLTGRSDLEQHAGAAALAVVPRTTSWRKSSDTYLVTESEPHSVASEAYRTLRTGLLFAASQREIKTVLVTSAQAAEGKTVTTANLGVVLAQAGKRVILVSADLRKPRLNNFFGSTAQKGLTNVLAGESRATEALVPVSVAASNLRLLPSGPIPGNPAELLGSEAMRKLIAELRMAADFVLIDVAPILAVADAMTLAPMCDSVLFIADAARATGGAIAQARQQLDQVNARLIGAVLNNFDPTKSRGYSTTSYSHYRHADDGAGRLRNVGSGRWGGRRN